MLNQNPKPYFNQVTMIESQYQSKRRMPTNQNASSLLQNKSPLRERERQNTNSINTPSRLYQQNNNNKTSLSPLRSRRNDSSMSGMPSGKSTAISRRKLVEYMCQNHNTKAAKFMIEKDSQYFYFCDRCAIPLISNGFKLAKIYEEEQKQENPRLKQINQFLKQLENMETGLNKKKQTVVDVLNEGQQQLDGQLEKIQQFYAQFYQIIDEHKRRVIEQMKTQYQKSSRGATSAKQIVEQAIKDSSNMKDDILASMNSVILEVMDHQFRSVMNQYYNNLNNFKEICNSKKEDPIKVRTLSFKDGESACQNLIQGLVIQWNDQDGEIEQKNQRTSKTEQSTFNYQSRPTRAREEQQSDRENPIECLETEQRGKPNIKQIGGLFCSFDE